MYKSIALLLLFGSAAICAPGRSDVDSLIDEIFDPTDAPPSSNHTNSTSTATDINEEIECTLRGKKGTCVAYYRCPEWSTEVIDLISIGFPEELECPHYLQVCCLSPTKEDNSKDSV